MSSLVIFTIFFIILYLIHRNLRKKVNIFKRRRILYEKPSVFFGNIGKVYFKKRSFLDVIERIYKKYENEKIVGLFKLHKPQLIVRDPKIVQQLLVENFNYFVNNIEKLDQSTDIICGQTLENLQNQQWHEMRSTLNVMFDDMRIEQMFDLMLNSSHKMIEFLNYKVNMNEEFIIDTKDITNKFTINSLAFCALGNQKVNCFRNKHEQIYKVTRKIANSFGMLGKFKSLIANVFPKLYKTLNFQLVDNQTEEFFHQAVIEEMKVRQVKKIIRPDMIQLLLEAKDGQLHHYGLGLLSSDDKSLKIDGNLRKLKHLSWPENYFMATEYSMFSNGFETVSNILQMVCYELVKNYDVQMELMDEIDEANERLNGEKITVEDINKMKFLNSVINETLRLWPPKCMINRVCTQNFQLNMDDGYAFDFQKNDEVIIPIFAIHRDQKYFENPLTFNPQRHTHNTIEEIIYFPFGRGPRSCILQNFAMQLVKIFIHQLLTHFTLEMCQKTPSIIQLKHSFEFDVREKIYMRLKSRNRN